MLGVVTSATVAWVGALSVFSPTTIGGWAIVIIGVAGTIYGARAHARQRAGEVWQTTAIGYKEQAQVAHDRAVRMERERDEQRALKHEALNGLAAMTAKTDLTVVMRALASIVTTQEAQTELLGKLVARVEAIPTNGNGGPL